MPTEYNEFMKYFQDIYENTLQKGETFTPDMVQHIDGELEKMFQEREEWLKKQRETF